MIPSRIACEFVGDRDWAETQDITNFLKFFSKILEMPVYRKAPPCESASSIKQEGVAQVPKISLMNDPAVVELVGKKIAQVEAKAAKDATRHYKAILRSVKEAIVTGVPDKRLAKALASHVASALAEHAPANTTQADAAD